MASYMMVDAQSRLEVREAAPGRWQQRRPFSIEQWCRPERVAPSACSSGRSHLEFKCGPC
eukprot:11341156-Alexandrium_andersonii.AAC.1